MVTMTPVSSARSQFARQQRRGVDIAARRNTHQQRLFARQTPHHAIGVFGFDPEIAIGQSFVIETRHDRRRHVLQPFQTMKPARWLRRIDLDMWQIAFQASRGPHKGSAGPHRRHEMRYAARRLPNNLRTRRIEVRFPVGRVVVLIGIKVEIGIGLVNLAHHAYRAIGALRRIAEYRFRAIRLQDAFPFTRRIAR